MWVAMMKSPQTTSSFPPILNSSSPQSCSFVHPSFLSIRDSSTKEMIGEHPHSSALQSLSPRISFCACSLLSRSPSDCGALHQVSPRAAASSCCSAARFCQVPFLTPGIAREMPRTGHSLHITPQLKAPQWAFRMGCHVLDRAHTPLWLSSACLPCLLL